MATDPLLQVLGAAGDGQLGHGERVVRRVVPGFAAALHRRELRSLAAVEGFEHLGARARAEFERLEQAVDLVGVEGAVGQVVHVHAKVDVAHQRVDLAVEAHLVDVGAQGLALLAADLVGVRDDAVEAAVLVDPLGGEPVADARHAGDVVGRLAAQRGQIRVLGGRHMVFLLDGLRRHVLEVLEMVPRIQHGDVVVDQLEGVAVAGQHQRAVAGPVAQRGERADHVVALIAGLFDIGHAEGLEHALDQRQLGEQLLGRRLARALVLGQHLVAEGAALDVERHGETVGPLRVDDLGQHGRETPHRVRGLAGLGAEVFNGKSEKSAERQRVAVNDQQRSARIGCVCGLSHRCFPAWDHRTWR